MTNPLIVQSRLSHVDIDKSLKNFEGQVINVHLAHQAIKNEKKQEKVGLQRETPGNTDSEVKKMSGLIREAGNSYLALTDHQVAGEEELKKAKKRARKQRELDIQLVSIVCFPCGALSGLWFFVTGGKETKWQSGR